MNAHRFALVVLLGLLPLSGCKSGGNAELLERDLRWHEEEIDDLENALQNVEAQLDSARRENEALKRELSTGDRGAADSPAAPVLDRAPSRSVPRPAAPRSRGRAPTPQEEPTTAPLVDPGELMEPGEGLDLSIPAEGASYTPEPTDRRITRIVLNKQLSGGVTHHGGADEGVMVVFEPRNQRGELIKAAGDVSIAVLDPNRQGAAARIARWDFTADEAIKQFHKKPLARGFQFQLPWPSTPPESKQLQLFVRYVTPDGRKLLADMKIDVAPPSEREAKRWRGVAPRPVDSARVREPLRSRPVSVDDAAPGELDGAAGGATVQDEDEGPQIRTEDREAAGASDVRSARPTWKPYR